MRAFILALAAIIPAFASDWAEADGLSAFDIGRNCKAEAAGSPSRGPRPAREMKHKPRMI
jgi:hypothetical protein